MYRIRLAGRFPPRQCFIIGPRHAPAAGRKLVPVGLASPILYLPPPSHCGGGIHLPLIVGLCFRLLAYSIAEIHQSGRTPLLPLYALFQFIAPEELTLRTLYELDATRHTPKKTRRALSPRRGPSLHSCRPLLILLAPLRRHVLNVQNGFCPCGALIV